MHAGPRKLKSRIESRVSSPHAWTIGIIIETASPKERKREGHHRTSDRCVCVSNGGGIFGIGFRIMLARPDNLFLWEKKKNNRGTNSCAIVDYMLTYAFSIRNQNADDNAHGARMPCAGFFQRYTRVDTNKQCPKRQNVKNSGEQASAASNAS